MSTESYNRILHLLQQLPEAQQVQLLHEMGCQIANSKQKDASISSLRGLGKEIWHDIDAQTYVNKERESWGG